LDKLNYTGFLFILLPTKTLCYLVPQAELDGEMTDQQVGLQARLMSKALRKITANLNKSNYSVIFINQLREKVGVMFGNPETTPGGRALKFYATIRLEVRRAESIKQGSDIIGNGVNVKVVKNKVAPPFKTASLEIVYGQGISRDGEIIDLAVSFDIIKKSGSWYEYKGEKIGQGREVAKSYLANNKTVMTEISEKIKAKMQEPAK
jgi:recombination protein RecA